MAKNVLHLIQCGMGQMSKGQKRIAAYILENYDKAAFMTANRLGKTTQVSESTVVRFASELGYDGYPSMQKALQEIIRGKLTSIQRIRASEDQMSGTDVLRGVMQRDMDSIRNTMEQVDRPSFDAVVARLIKAHHIYILGVRSSSFLAGYLNFYLHLIFKNVTLVQSSAAGEIFEQLVRIAPGDVLIGISFPRYSAAAVTAVRFARSRGAEVIAITDSEVSPLYHDAEAALLVRSDMISFVDSMTAPLSLLNALIVAVGQQMNQEISGTFAELESIWSKYDVFGKTEDEQ
ncbi:MAG: MurR/RpiR family transcriptional regulator [Clostridiales bacterium]|nr:MurR/RpiR family transcriptional regulator [Clostridiales bacterium]